MTLATPPFGTIFGGHVRTVPGNKYVKFQVRSFNVFELLAFNSHWPAAARTQTDRQTDRHTSNERIISAIHFVHLAEINIFIIIIVSSRSSIINSFSCLNLTASEGPRITIHGRTSERSIFIRRIRHWFISVFTDLPRLDAHLATLASKQDHTHVLYHYAAL